MWTFSSKGYVIIQQLSTFSNTAHLALKLLRQTVSYSWVPYIKKTSIIVQHDIFQQNNQFCDRDIWLHQILSIIYYLSTTKFSIVQVILWSLWCRNILNKRKQQEKDKTNSSFPNKDKLHQLIIMQYLIWTLCNSNKKNQYVLREIHPRTSIKVNDEFNDMNDSM